MAPGPGGESGGAAKVSHFRDAFGVRGECLARLEAEAASSKPLKVRRPLNIYSRCRGVTERGKALVGTVFVAAPPMTGSCVLAQVIDTFFVQRQRGGGDTRRLICVYVFVLLFRKLLARVSG